VALRPWHRRAGGGLLSGLPTDVAVLPLKIAVLASSNGPGCPSARSASLMLVLAQHELTRKRYTGLTREDRCTATQSATVQILVFAPVADYARRK